MSTPVVKLPPPPSLPAKPEKRRVMLEVLLGQQAHVVEEFSRFANRPVETLCLSVIAGTYIAFGAVLAVVFPEGVAAQMGTGIAKIISGFGFVIGFSLVVMTGAILFTELNVSCPIYILVHGRENLFRVLRMWGFALLGNAAGAGIVAGLLAAGNSLSSTQVDNLRNVCVAKLSERDNGVGGWITTVVSALMANWMVGMAAILAGQGRTVPGASSAPWLCVRACECECVCLCVSGFLCVRVRQ